MNSRLDWLVLSDYYSIYVTNAPPIVNNTNPEQKRGSYYFFSRILRHKAGFVCCDKKQPFQNMQQ